MVGILLPYWGGLFSEAFAVSFREGTLITYLRLAVLTMGDYISYDNIFQPSPPYLPFHPMDEHLKSEKKKKSGWLEQRVVFVNMIFIPHLKNKERQGSRCIYITISKERQGLEMYIYICIMIYNIYIYNIPNCGRCL